jgi:hypothetical protein
MIQEKMRSELIHMKLEVGEEKSLRKQLHKATLKRT